MSCEKEGFSVKMPRKEWIRFELWLWKFQLLRGKYFSVKLKLLADQEEAKLFFVKLKKLLKILRRNSSKSILFRENFDERKSVIKIETKSHFSVKIKKHFFVGKPKRRKRQSFSVKPTQQLQSLEYTVWKLHNLFATQIYASCWRFFVKPRRKGSESIKKFREIAERSYDAQNDSKKCET